MQHRILRRVVLSFAVAIVAVGSLTLMGCPSDDEEARTVNQAVGVNTTTVAAVQAQAFTLPSGTVFGLAATTTPTLTFNTPTTFTLASGGSTATGPVVFGSCTLTVTGPLPPSVPLRPLGTIITFPTCNIQVNAVGTVAVGGASVQGTITLVLTGTTSSPITLPVSIDSDGTLVVNGVDTGAPVTGTSGG
jgi:hypothetical protein